MKPGWLIGIIMAFVIFTVVFGISEDAYMGAEETSKLGVLMKPFMQAGVIQGLLTAVGSLFSLTFWDTLWAIFWWDYPSVFHGGWLIFRYIFFIPLSFGVVFSIALATIRGVSSS